MTARRRVQGWVAQVVLLLVVQLAKSKWKQILWLSLKQKKLLKRKQKLSKKLKKQKLMLKESIQINVKIAMEQKVKLEKVIQNLKI